MGKKRKTKQQKIISKLKRELAQQQVVSVKQVKSVKPIKSVNKEKLDFAYEPKLIKKDLIKTTILSLIFIALIFILKFSHFEELFFRQ